MLVSKTEFAKSQGFTQPYVSYLINKGYIIPVKDKIDPEQALAALAAIRKPGRRLFRKGTPETESSSSQTSKTAELSTVLLKTRIKNEVKTGQYLDAQMVEKEAFILEDIEL